MTAAMKTRVRQQIATVRKDLADLERLLGEDDPGQEQAPDAPARSAPVLMAADEAAAALGIGTTKLKQLVAHGAIKSVRIGTRRLFSNEHLREFVEGAQGEPERRRPARRGGRR